MSKFYQPVCLCNADILPHKHEDDRIIQFGNYQRPNVHIPKMDIAISELFRGRGFVVAK